MQTPPELNSQQIWGGHQSRTGSSENDQTIRTRGAQQELVGNVPSSQSNLLASDSDDLFHPTSAAPSHVFNLPDVPLNPHPYYNTYHQNMTSLPRHFHHPNSPTSYNNPSFAIPPPPPRGISHNNRRDHPPNFVRNDISPFRAPAPPIPPFVPRQPAYTQFPPNQFPPNQPAYIPPLPPPNTQIHYYLPHPSSSPSSTLSPVSKALPTTTHIPLLTSKLDFYSWDEAVTTLLHHQNMSALETSLTYLKALQGSFK